MTGSLEDGTEVTATVTVDRVNYVWNPSFEDADTSMELYAVVDGTELTAPFLLTTYADWQNPTVSDIQVKVTDGTLTIGARYHCNVNSWGTLDDVTLHRVGD